MKKIMLMALIMGLAVQAQELDAALKGKVQAKLTALKAWGSDPTLVAAVKAHNAGLGTEAKAMNNEHWKGLGLGDDFVKGYIKNAAGERLRALKDSTISEAFMSGADGKKVAFLAKTTSWSHAGKAKHDQPMKGGTWIGTIEVDESTGVRQVQVSFPVVDGGSPIGSIVVGLNIGRL